jgi:hypothetical protein
MLRGIVVDASETGFHLFHRRHTDRYEIEDSCPVPREYELANFEVAAEIIRKKARERGEEGYQYE